MAAEKEQGAGPSEGRFGKTGDDACGCGGNPGPVPLSQGKCICPKCNRTEPLKQGVPCFKTQCPGCGTPMIYLG